jgi:hypothetical protein
MKIKDIPHDLEAGPTAWDNWHAFSAGFPAGEAFEVTCYTDARITGVVDSIGPYAILNPIAPTTGVGHPVPGVVVSVDVCLPKRAYPDMKETDYSRYHEGPLDDELASLLSLSLGIRVRSGALLVFFEKETRAELRF